MLAGFIEKMAMKRVSDTLTLISPGMGAELVQLQFPAKKWAVQVAHKDTWYANYFVHEGKWRRTYSFDPSEIREVGFPSSVGAQEILLYILKEQLRWWLFFLTESKGPYPPIQPILEQEQDNFEGGTAIQVFQYMLEVAMGQYQEATTPGEIKFAQRLVEQFRDGYGE
jgi:hypothetical protein